MAGRGGIGLGVRSGRWIVLWTLVMRLPFPLKVILALFLIWGATGAVVWLAGRGRVTPESIAAYLESHPLDPAADAAGREQVIRRVADQINRLDAEQRQTARNRRDGSGQAMRNFFAGMRPEERALFVELTIGPTFSHLMASFNQMSREERRGIASNAIERLRKEGAVPPEEARLWEEQGPEVLEKVVSQGLRSYYQEASADTKLDFAPVLEAMQRVLQSPRGQWKQKPAY